MPILTTILAPSLVFYGSFSVKSCRYALKPFVSYEGWTTGEMIGHGNAKVDGYIVVFHAHPELKFRE